MSLGSDKPGKIIKIPGGVALNLAMALQKNGFNSSLLSAIGADNDGDQLIEQIKLRGIETEHIYRAKSFPTDKYMAVEGSNGLIGAIADTHTLERCEKYILSPLENGNLYKLNEPWAGIIILDGNLTENLLNKINNDPLFRNIDLRIAPASPGKASRLRTCLNGNVRTVYLNLEEANLIVNQNFNESSSAAIALLNAGFKRAVVTNGGSKVTVAEKDNQISITPPNVDVVRVTGAGDVFMASHIQAELIGKQKETAINFALNQTAKYISGSEKL
jgi:sugar/nucleoside kinase (ribokinase family)